MVTIESCALIRVWKTLINANKWWRLKSSGMGSCVIGQAVPAVWKDHSAFKTAGTVHPMTQHYMPEDLNLHQYYYENNQRDTLYRLIYYSKLALPVLGKNIAQNM